MQLRPQMLLLQQQGQGPEALGQLPGVKAASTSAGEEPDLLGPAYAEKSHIVPRSSRPLDGRGAMSTVSGPTGQQITR